MIINTKHKDFGEPILIHIYIKNTTVLLSGVLNQVLNEYPIAKS